MPVPEDARNSLYVALDKPDDIIDGAGSEINLLNNVIRNAKVPFDFYIKAGFYQE